MKMVNNIFGKVSASIITILLILISVSSIILFAIPVRACHSVGTFESDYVTPKTTFLQGEIVYGKETYHPVQHLRLRIRDPNDNVVFCSDPVYGNEVKCAYRLDDYAPIGKWNIQVGLYKKGSWNWLKGAGDISYFDVIASLKYVIDTHVIGSGTVSKNPNQEDYANGTVVTLTAEPGSGWTFDHWSGDLSGSSNPETITIDSDKSVTANFIKKSNGGGSKGGSNSGSSGSSNGQSVGENVGEDQENMPPVADAGELYEGLVDSEILFNGSLSYDPDGYITGWYWNFGDGTSDVGKTVYHCYSNAGAYTVCLNVTDDDGAFNHSDVSVVVIQPNRSPSDPEINGPTEVKEGKSYTYTIVSTDEDNDLIKCSLDWGDGDTDESGWLSSGDVFTIKHTWKSAGSFTVKATADDDQLDSSSEITVKVEEVESEETVSPMLFFVFLPFALPLFFVFRKKHMQKKVK